VTQSRLRADVALGVLLASKNATADEFCIKVSHGDGDGCFIQLWLRPCTIRKDMVLHRTWTILVASNHEVLAIHDGRTIRQLMAFSLNLVSPGVRAIHERDSPAVTAKVEISVSPTTQ
jgi:hypothetical protein